MQDIGRLLRLLGTTLRLVAIDYQRGNALVTQSSNKAPISCRQKFPMVRHKVGTLAGYLRKAGPERSIDMDEAGMRLALDIVALVGFLMTAGSSTYKFQSHWAV